MSTNSTSLASHDAEHERVWSTLPWLVNGTLSVVEQQRVERHSSTCLVCRREVLALGALREAMASRTLEPKCETALVRLHERIDNDAAGRIFPWAAAAVLAVVTGLVGLAAINIGLIPLRDQDNAYSTLGARSIELDDDTVAKARIVFEHDVTERQLRELLLAFDAELIDGPTPRGAYTIGMPRVTRSEELQAVVASLRQSKRVIFVEPVVVSRSQRSEY
jgi:hypothetical protein